MKSNCLIVLPITGFLSSPDIAMATESLQCLVSGVLGVSITLAQILQ